MVDTRDLKSLGRIARAGSSPALGTIVGEMAEWSKAAALKAVEGHTSQGSNPCLSAITNSYLPNKTPINISYMKSENKNIQNRSQPQRDFVIYAF